MHYLPGTWLNDSEVDSKTTQCAGDWWSRVTGLLLTADLGVAEVTGVGGGVITHAARGVDICQERPRAGQGHVDNQTGLKHSHIRFKNFLNQNQRWYRVELILLYQYFWFLDRFNLFRAVNLRDKSLNFNLKKSCCKRNIRLAYQLSINWYHKQKFEVDRPQGCH